MPDYTFTTDQRGAGAVVPEFSLMPQESRTVTFLITWYFPNLHEIPDRYTAIAKESPGWVGHVYNNWYDSSVDVAQWTAGQHARLYQQTGLFCETYRDATLPHWLMDRISMSVSTLAAGCGWRESSGRNQVDVRDFV